MADKTKALAEYGHNPKYDNAADVPAKAGRKQQKAPASAGEVVQRRANKANHSERVFHGGKPASGSRA